jgi:hypothetical protein
MTRTLAFIERTLDDELATGEEGRELALIGGAGHRPDVVALVGPDLAWVVCVEDLIRERRHVAGAVAWGSRVRRRVGGGYSITVIVLPPLLRSALPVAPAEAGLRSLGSERAGWRPPRVVIPPGDQQRTHQSCAVTLVAGLVEDGARGDELDVEQLECARERAPTAPCHGSGCFPFVKRRRKMSVDEHRKMSVDGPGVSASAAA